MAPPDDPEEPSGRPDYRVYRTRKPLFRRRAPGDERDELSRLRGEARQPLSDRAEPPDGATRRGRRGRRPRVRKPINGWRIARWALLAIVSWVAVAALVFLVSAQIQQGKVSDADKYLGGAGDPLTAANNILVLGSDVRDDANAEPGAQTTGNGRSDSILLMRVGGGANSRMSIARDTLVDIPGAGRQRINAAYSIGGTPLAVRTIEAYTRIDINHVMIVSFADFPDLIDAMGGVTYRGGCIVSRINGGSKNGGYTLRLPAGKTHINGKQALALARTRKNACNPNEDDLTRARRQQKIVGAMKRRLLSPMAFVRLPLISWNVPKALRSDMGGPTLLGLFGALAFVGTPQAEVLGTPSGRIPDSIKKAKVRRFLAG